MNRLSVSASALIHRATLSRENSIAMPKDLCPVESLRRLYLDEKMLGHSRIAIRQVRCKKIGELAIVLGKQGNLLDDRLHMVESGGTGGK